MERFEKTTPFGGNRQLIKGKPRRIMRRFRLTEISAVDNPAQKGATMTIMKRAEEGSRIGEYDRSSLMARSKQAGHLCYDAEDFDNLEFEHDDEDRSAYIDQVAEMAKGDFSHLVEVLKQMEPGMTGCEALAKARRMAPNTVAKMNGKVAPASYNTKAEALAVLSKQEFRHTVNEIAKRDKCDRATAMSKARREDPEGFATAFGLGPDDLPVVKSVASKDKENWELEVEGEKERTKCSHSEAARRVAQRRPDLRIGKARAPLTTDLAGMSGPNAMADDTSIRDWKWCVAKIQSRDGCTYTEAMTRARKEHRAEFEAFQNVGGQQTRGGTV